MPWWAWLGVSWLAGCALALLWWVTHIGRRPFIDMRDLTGDPADATVDETLTRIEPYRQHADEAIEQSRQRVGSQDFLDAAEIRRQFGGRS